MVTLVADIDPKDVVIFSGLNTIIIMYETLLTNQDGFMVLQIPLKWSTLENIPCQIAN